MIPICQRKAVKVFKPIWKAVVPGHYENKLNWENVMESLRQYPKEEAIEEKCLKTNKPILYVATLFNWFLVDVERQRKSFLMECLMLTVGSGTEQKATLHHLPAGINELNMWSTGSHSALIYIWKIILTLWKEKHWHWYHLKFIICLVFDKDFIHFSFVVRNIFLSCSKLLYLARNFFSFLKSYIYPLKTTLLTFSRNLPNRL